MYKVSVIIPMYNVEDYLRECLDSVVNQTLKDIEVICVDDGSPDRSAEIAAEYVEKYSNFKLIRKENGGLSSARNAALDVAAGEYVSFLDSDDYIDANMLEVLYRTAGADQLDIVFFNAALAFDNVKVRKQNEDLMNYYSRTKDYSGVCTGQSMFAKMRKDHKLLTSVCLQMFRREFLEEHQFRFYSGILHEDNLFTFQCAMAAQKVNYVPDAFYFRRVHEESITTSRKTIRHVEGYIVSYYEALIFLRGIQLQEDAAPMVSDFLFGSLYWNACNIWKNLTEEEKNRPLSHGGIGAEQLLHVGIRAIRAENQRDLLIQENRQSGLRKLMRKIKGFFRCAANDGFGYAIRKTVRQCSHAFAGFMTAHTSGAVQKFFWNARESGYRVAMGKVVQSCRNGILQIPKLLRVPFVKLRQKNGGKAPLVSFILPVYNVEEFLEEGLDTLIQQTMPHIEIICVDDGSTDRSLEILNRYAAKDARIRVFTQKNQFAGAARNLGLREATGEYLVFLDSDDFFAEDLAKEAYFAAKLNRADMVLFGAKHFDNVTKEYREAPWLFRKEYAPKKQPFNRKDCSNKLYQITTPCPWTKMFRREFVLKTGLQFQTLRNSNDVFFTYSALAMAERITIVDRPLVYYRVGLTSNLQATKGKDPMCFYAAYKALHDKLAEAGVLDAVRQSYVNATLSGCLHNWRTQKDPEVKLAVQTALKTKVLQELELTGHEESYFYLKQHYSDLRDILSED